MEVQDYKVADKAFTELVAYNCFKVVSEVYIIHRKNLKVKLFLANFNLNIRD